MPQKRRNAFPSSRSKKRPRRDIVFTRAELLCDLTEHRIKLKDEDIPEDDEGVRKFEKEYMAQLDTQGDRVYTDETLGIRVHRVMDAMSTVDIVTKKHFTRKKPIAKMFFFLMRAKHGSHYRSMINLRTCRKTTTFSPTVGYGESNTLKETGARLLNAKRDARVEQALSKRHEKNNL